MTDGNLQKQLGDMQAELLREIGSVRAGNSDALMAIALEVGKLEVRIAGMEISVSEQVEIKQRIKGLEDNLTSLKTEWASFKGEKTERDKNADNRSRVWMRIAGSVIAAAIIGFGGAGFALWKQSQENHLLQTQVLELARKEQDARMSRPNGH